MRLFISVTLCLPLIIYSMTTLAIAEHINIGIYEKPTTLDPHLEHTLPNWTIHSNIYHYLSMAKKDSFNFTEAGYSYTGLIEKYEVINDKKINIILRDDIKFHDKSSLGAEDVIYTINRIKSMEKSAFKKNISSIVSMKEKSRFIIELTIKGNIQDTKQDLLEILIIKKGSKDNPIGSGLYRVESYSKNLDEIRLVKTEENTGKKNNISSASYIYIKEKKDKINQFINKKIDILDKVGSTDIEQIKAKIKEFNVQKSPSNILYFLEMDQLRDNSPFIKKTSNQSLYKNPFKNKKVRLAMSLAIDRDYITHKAMNGDAEPAYQYLNKHDHNYLKNNNAITYNIKKALKLLKQSGYKKGFEVTLHTTPDQQLAAQTISKMLEEINIKVNVAIVSEKKEFYQKKYNFEYSLTLSGWITYSPDNYINNILSTYNKEEKLGLYNAGRYSNPRLDKVGRAIANATTKAEKDSLEKQGMLLALNDSAIITLYHLNNTYVSHKKIHLNEARTNLPKLHYISIKN